MKRVLVTGFPGFVAGFLVERLAARAEIDELVLLVEERLLEAARSRAAAIDGTRCRVVAGDITRADLGLAAEVAGHVLETVDTVFHLAAVYDLAMSREVGMKVNVGGTENVNDLVGRMRGLESYNYVSTVVVHGEAEGHHPEDAFPEGVSFRNFYEETKHLAELPVRRMMADHPVRIFRPAVVVGSSRTGYTVKYDGPYMVLRAIERLPGPLGRINVGTACRLNLVPVDFVTDAMAAIAARPDSIGRTFHLADPDPVPTTEVCEIFCRAMRGKGTWARLPGPLLRAATATPLATWLLGVPRAATGYFFADQTFETANTTRFLEGTGVACPRLADYAPTLVEYFRGHPEPGR